ncbi:MAG: hypothetical protein L6V87_00430 [Ruminococcus sp.]|nr:MAG: hypothetical protein L6V87_00430 [Ruminococcus sp.]
MHRKKSIYNQFYSDLVTPLKDNIRVGGTTVHIFYALKMGEKYFDRYNKHFPDADIVARDYSHEQLFNELSRAVGTGYKALLRTAL